MKNPFLIGKSIYLRALEENDLEGNYVAWLNNADVCRYNSHHVFPYTRDAAKAYIQGASTSRTMLVLAIVLKKKDRHIGNISLQNINHLNQSAEFAILIGEKDCWGKGYSKEAALLVIKHGFNELNLNRIFCGTAADNAAMQKLAVSLGMTEEGRRREAMFKHGRFVDIMEYGILKGELFDKVEKGGFDE